MATPLSKDAVALRKQSNTGLPISKLPPDILGDIFLLAFDPTFFPSHRTRLNISSVCSYWRAVALDRATLWSTILVDVDTATLRNDVAAWVELCILRSREADLDVTFTAMYGRAESMRPFQAVTALLLPHQHRFRRVNISLYHNIFTQSLIPTYHALTPPHHPHYKQTEP